MLRNPAPVCLRALCVGDYAGFVVGWSDWISTCGTSAAISVVIAEYLGVLFPALAVARRHCARHCHRLCRVAMARRALGQPRAERHESAQALAFIASSLPVSRSATRAQHRFRRANQLLPMNPFFLRSSWVASGSLYLRRLDGVIIFLKRYAIRARRTAAMFGGVLAIIAIYVLVNLALSTFTYLTNRRSGPGRGAAANAIFGQYATP